MRRLRGWRRGLRYLQVAVAGVLGLAIALLAFAVIAGHTAWGRAIIRDELEVQLRDAFAYPIHVGSIEGDPFAELVVRDLVIDGPEGKAVVKVGRLAIALQLVPLLHHDLQIDRLVADDVEVHAIQAPRSEELVLAHLLKPAPPSLWTIAIADGQLHRARVILDHDEVTKIEAFGKMRVEHDAPIDLVATVTATWRDLPAVVTAIAHGDIKDGFVVPALAGELGDARLTIIGGSFVHGAFGGVVSARAPAAVAARLGLIIPNDVELVASASRKGTSTTVAASATAGGSTRVSLFATGDLGAGTALGVVADTDVDLGQLTRGKLTGRGGAVAMFDLGPGSGDLPTGGAVALAWGHVADLPATVAAIALTTDRDRVHVIAGLASSASSYAGVSASVQRSAGSLVLEAAHVVATSSDPASATGGRAPVHGMLIADLGVHGQLSPTPDLAVIGHVDGRRLRAAGLSIASMHLQIAAAQLPAHPMGKLRLDATEVARGDVALTSLSLDAANRRDGKIAVALRSVSKRGAMDADAVVTLGETTIVALDHHRIAGLGATWEGMGGQLAIGTTSIELRGLRSTSRDGSVAVDGSYRRGTGNFDAHANTSFELAGIVPAAHGRIDARIDLERRRGVLGGSITAKASHVHSDDQPQLVVDGESRATFAGGKLLATAQAAVANLGGAKLAIDLDLPRDLARLGQLSRRAINSAKLTITGLDLTAASQLAKLAPIRGRVDAELDLDRSTMSATVSVRDVHTRQFSALGAISADLHVKPADHGDVTAELAASVAGIGGIRLAGELALPELFDLAAWKRFGLPAIKSATLRADEVAFDPALLQRFGIVSPLHGKLALAADLAPGQTATTFWIEVRDLQGGALIKPVTIRLDAAIDERSTRAKLGIRTARVSMFELDASLPITFATLRADPRAILRARLEGRARIPEVPASELLGVLGHTELTAGELDGQIELAGTIRRPTGKATLTATHVTMPATRRDQAPVLDKVVVDASWDGVIGKLSVDAAEAKGGTLKIVASAPASNPSDVSATLDAKGLDLAPLLAFAPGPAGGIAGNLEAHLSVHGLDPRTAQLAGSLHLTDGRVPIAPAVGTLFKSDIKVTIADHTIVVAATGRLGHGDIKLAATAPLDGTSVSSGHAELTLHKVQLISSTQPIIDATLSATLARVDERWRAQVDVETANIQIPDEKGTPLSPVGAPSDVIERGKPRPRSKTARIHQPPEHPLIVAKVAIHKTEIKSKELTGVVAGTLTLLVGTKDVGISGEIALERGDLDLFSRRYVIDRAAMHFDGPIDPILDIRISHDFPDVTTITEVHGRLSQPKLTLSSQPGMYSQEDLLGFLLGGEPNGDPNSASAANHVQSAGTSFLANQLGGYVRKALPVDIDVLRYDTATALNSAAVTVGTWLTHALFLSYRQHLSARPDENAGEGDVEYWLKQRLVLEGTVGDRGYDGLDLLWRRRW